MVATGVIKLELWIVFVNGINAMTALNIFLRKLQTLKVLKIIYFCLEMSEIHTYIVGCTKVQKFYT